MNRFLTTILSVLLTLSLFGCGTTKPEPKLGEPLRVGITPNYPPLIFKQDVEVAGLEADLARQLAAELLRPVEFVELEWDDLIPALLNGQIDIIMSGLSVTRDRQNQVAFSRPYLETGIAVLRRKKEAKQFDSQEAVAKSIASAGVQKDTSAEAFVKEQFPDIGVKEYATPADAALDLRKETINLFLSNGPVIASLTSEFEKELSPMKGLLTQEQLAWAVGLDDEELLSQVNARLTNWKKNGTLDRALTQWLPNRKQMKDLLRVPVAP